MSAPNFVPQKPSRRDFLKSAGALAVTISFQWAGPPRRAAAAAMAGVSPLFAPNAFLRIGADNSVTIIAKHLEMGQGCYTGIATVLADELDADWSLVRVESAPADVKRYANLAFKMQGTGGSSAMANSWEQLRDAGAKGRAIMMAAAAKEWKVPVAEITVDRSVVYHTASQRQATFGSLVKTAVSLPVPETVVLKDAKDFKLIGASATPRVDVASKVDGTAQFTLDFEAAGMLVALLQRPPQFGATVKSVNDAAALAIPGVVKVVTVPGGVAVVAKGFWAAKKGRDALVIEWDDTQAEKRGSAQLMDEYRKLADKPGISAKQVGDAVPAIRDATHKLSAEYEFPYLAHAPMEPLDAVVKLTATSCEIWAGDQFQTVDQMNAAKTAGLKPDQVSITTLYAGGSFGRRANMQSDYIVEAVSIAKAFGADGTPIKLQWTREDDIRGGHYRPMYFHRIEAGLNEKKELTGWHQRIVGQSIMGAKDKVDPTSVEGAATMAYDIPNLSVESTNTDVGVPILWWRVVGSSHTVFAVETFMDEVAHAAGEDPYTFRRKHLEHEPRMKAVLELAAEKSDWNTPLPKGRGRGIAVAEAFKTLVAQVVEVTVDDKGHLTIDRVVCAVDCGTPINPDVIVAQMEGGIGFGIGAIRFGEITLKDGRVEQNNFNSYRVLRMNEMPKVEVHIVRSNLPPTGVGEPGVAPVGPAIANAIFAVTGKRIRSLPFPKSIVS